jgi:hypothetical protein
VLLPLPLSPTFCKKPEKNHDIAKIWILWLLHEEQGKVLAERMNIQRQQLHQAEYTDSPSSGLVSAKHI